MRRTLLAAAACAALALLAPAGATPSATRTGLPLVQVRVDDPAQAAWVATHFDETHNPVPGYVEIVLWPGDAARLTERGFTWQVVAADLTRDRAATAGALVAMPGPDREDYRRLDDYEKELKDLARKHPSLVRLITMPNRTLEGRTVYGVEIAANVKAKDGRPTFLVDGLHHAREWPAGEFPMIYAHSLVEEYGRVARTTNLLKQLRVVVVPVVNPDGFDYSRESPIGDAAAVASQGAYWRKNRRSFTGLTIEQLQFNPDAHGVDPNRNYGHMWGDDIGGSSSVQVNETHRGAAPFSEPESRNLRQLMLGRAVTVLVTNHTYGNLVMHPWGFTEDDTPDEKLFDALGEKLAVRVGDYQNWKAIELYATSGGSRDWAYGALGTLSYTFEHGKQFHPAYVVGVGDIWPDVLAAFRIAADAAAKPAYHSTIAGRVVDSAGRPVKATLTLSKKFNTPLWPSNPTGDEDVQETISMSTATASDGSFAWQVNPSVRRHVPGGANESYTLTVKAGSRTKTFKVVVKRGQTVRLGTIRF